MSSSQNPQKTEDRSRKTAPAASSSTKNRTQTQPSALSSRSSANARPDRRPLLPPAVARAARASAINGGGVTPPSSISSSSSASAAGSVGSKASGGKSLFQSYLSLSANTRIIFGVVIGVVGLAGMMVDRNVLQDNNASAGGNGSGERSSEGKGFEVRMVDRK
ncbi:hypothetical protein IAT40_003396 [Kwoniella sp. CBS 6097]